MGRNTVVGDVLHFLGADLDFNIHMHAEQSGVQGLIAIGLGHGNVVLETARQRLVEAVYGAEDAIAVVLGVGDDAERVHIHDFVEGFLLELHLVVDAVQMLFPAQDAAGQASLFQFLLQFATDIVNDFPVAAPKLCDRLGNVL